MEFFERLEAERGRYDVLSHPFYTRWSAGELTREELALYAGQYRHAVLALAEQSRAAAEAADDPATRTELELHAREEEAHVELWDRFVHSLGGSTEATPAAESKRCAAAWTAGESQEERLAVLFAVESAQPAISQTKLDGLAEHYGVAPDDDAASYFALHSRRDEEHAAQARRLIEANARRCDDSRLLEVALGALEGNWDLLDGVERAIAAEAAAPVQ
ncbi:MAG: iron-containing redox enzyme family protein [Thermoleophilaceae bacterium]